MEIDRSKLQVCRFHEDRIVTFEHDGVPFVTMRQVVKNMGLDWKSQHLKLQQQKAKFMCGDITTRDSAGRLQSMLAIPVEKLPLWLASINPAKIRDNDIRAKVETYQAESAIVLHDYWIKGRAVQPQLPLGPEPATEITVRPPDTATPGIVTHIIRRELQKTLEALTKQNRHIWRAIAQPNMLALKDAGYCEIGETYRLAGLPVSGLPAQQKLSGNISRSLDAYCKRHGYLLRSARAGSREITYWPRPAVVDWLAEQGHEIIRQHMAKAKGKPDLKVVPIDGLRPTP